ncbi:hypothetical protein Drorol1_Dr00005176 [Drosera rotundifolia]
MFRFNRAYIQFSGLSGEVAVVALQTGLLPGLFTNNLTLKLPRNFGDLLHRTHNYMALEDQNQSRASLEGTKPAARPERVGRPERGRTGRDFQPRRYNAPGTAPPLWAGSETRVSTSQNPLPIRTVDAKSKANDPHSSRPPVDNCKAPPPPNRNRSKSPDQGGTSKRPRLNNNGGPVINVIYGGTSSGRDSSRGRKRYAQEEIVGSVVTNPPVVSHQEDMPLVFTKEDETEVKYPHQDALLVAAMI